MLEGGTIMASREQEPMSREDQKVYEPPRPEKYYPMAKHLANKAYKSLHKKFRFFDSDDLMHEGAIRLIKDIRKHGFDKTKSPFKYYAEKRIKWGILDALKKWGDVPQKKWKAIENVLKKQEELAQKYGREPSLEELAKSLNISLERLIEILTWRILIVFIEDLKVNKDNEERAFETPDLTVNAEELGHLSMASEEIDYYIRKELSEFDRLLYRLRVKHNKKYKDIVEIIKIWFPGVKLCAENEAWAKKKAIEEKIKKHLSGKGWPDREISQLF